MNKVIVTKGASTGKTGIATVGHAYGPIDKRVFSVLVILDDNSGTIELPTDAIRWV